MSIEPNVKRAARSPKDSHALLLAVAVGSKWHGTCLCHAVAAEGLCGHVLLGMPRTIILIVINLRHVWAIERVKTNM